MAWFFPIFSLFLSISLGGILAVGDKSAGKSGARSRSTARIEVRLHDRPMKGLVPAGRKAGKLLVS
jgi:hypothetical protein